MYRLKKNAENAISEYFLNASNIKSFSINFVSKFSEISCNHSALRASNSFLRVYFESSPEAGSLIRNEVWLPEEWNGDLIGYGNGGMAGEIPIDLLEEGIERNFAAVTTDMGTSRGVFSGVDYPEVAVDFGHRATHLMTVIAKKIIRAAYGREPFHSFFKGGSTGGEQALSEAQRYPEDYDAILCGAPANNRICLHLYFLWNFLHLKDQNRKPLFDFETCKQITQSAVEFANRQGDGRKGDQFITFPKSDPDTLHAFVSSVSQQLSLSKEQSSALYAVYDGPKNAKNGKRIYNGMPLGSELYDCGLYDTAVSDTSPHDYLFYWALGKSFDPFDFDFNQDAETVIKKLSIHMSANDADLSPFFGRGGKLMIVSGTADACVPFPDALRYAVRVSQAVGKEQTNQNFRFYLIPSVDHRIAGCNPNDVTSEDGKDLLTLLIEWYYGTTVPGSLCANLHGYKESNIQKRLVDPINLDKFDCSLLFTTDESYLNLESHQLDK